MAGDTDSPHPCNALGRRTRISQKGQGQRSGEARFSYLAADVGAFCPHYYYASSSSPSPVKLLEEPHEIVSHSRQHTA